jgi:hypothetical protein
MMKGHDTVLVTHQKQQSKTQAAEDEMEVVSPSLGMQVVNPHYAPASDKLENDDSDLKGLLVR